MCVRVCSRDGHPATDWFYQVQVGLKIAAKKQLSW